MRIIEILPGIRLVCGKGIPDMEDQRSREVRIAQGASPAGSAASLVVSSCRGAAVRFQESVAEKSLSERFPQMNFSVPELKKKYCRGQRSAVISADAQLLGVFGSLACGAAKPTGASVRPEYLQLKIAELLFLLSEELQEEVRHNSYFSPAVIERVRYAHDLFCRDLQKPWTAGEMAEAGGLSESMFRRCFREVYGIPAAEYMRHHRLEQAAELLKTSEESILEIAAQVGYENPGKFAARFRRQYGCPPREYRLQQKKVGNEMEQFERNGLD